MCGYCINTEGYDIRVFTSFSVGFYKKGQKKRRKTRGNKENYRKLPFQFIWKHGETLETMKRRKPSTLR